jgi:hypothetical protein
MFEGSPFLFMTKPVFNTTLSILIFLFYIVFTMCIISKQAHKLVEIYVSQ